MTTIEAYRPPHQFLDANLHLRHTIARNAPPACPPACPSPPRISTRTSPPRKPHHPADFSPIVSMAYQESTQWLFTDAEVLSTPSILDGIDPAEESCRRAKGVNFIIQVGMLLKLPQLTLAVASVFFHRMYMRRSLYVDNPHKDQGAMAFHHYNIAATALFLATKTEENCRKTKEIVIAVAKVAQKNTSLIIDEQSKEYWKWRDSILLYEELMLELLTFDVVLRTPHSYLVPNLQMLQIDDNKQVRNVAWAFLNDSMMTTLCLRMKSPDICIASIYFAVKFYGETIPDDDNERPWWEILGGDADSIVKAVSIMHDFWSDNPLKLPDRPYGQDNYASSPEDLADTRRKGSEAEYSGEDTRSEILSQNGNGSVKRKSDEEDGELDEPAVKKPRTSQESVEVKTSQHSIDAKASQGSTELKEDAKVEIARGEEGSSQLEEGEANAEEGEVA